MAASNEKAKEKPKVRFRVLRGATKLRVPYATLRFTDPAGVVSHRDVDEDGDLELELDKLKEGQHSVLVACDEYRPEVEAFTVPPDDETLENGRVVFRIHHLTKDIDQEKGKAWVHGLAWALGGLVVLYLILHSAFQEPGAFAGTMMRANANVEAAFAATTGVPPAATLKPRVDDLEIAVTKADVAGKVATVLGKAAMEIGRLRTLLGFDEPSSDEADDDKGGDDKGGDDKGGDDKGGDDKEKKKPEEVRCEALGMLARIDSLALEIETLEAESHVVEGAFLWRTGAKRYFEVLLWALAGIMVRLILEIAGYVRWHRFYAAGIVQHWALLIAAPFLTLVFVLLISLVKVQIGSSIVDGNDPRVLVAVAFLLAAVPWKLWDWVQATGKKVVATPSAAKDP